MIKKLRIRFTIIASIAILLVLVIVLSVVNFWNYSSTVSYEMSMIDYISQTDGNFPGAKNPDALGPDDISSQTGLPSTDSSSSTNTAPGSQPDEHMDVIINEESAYTTRYFCVTFDADGNTDEVSTGHIAAITPETAEEYANEVYSSGKESGYYDIYRYKTFTTEDGGTKIIFLNCENDIRDREHLLLLSIISACICQIAATILVSVFSRRAVQPIADNIEKQKQFISNAGHELKTPITIISTNAEILSTDENNREWTDSIKKQVARLNHLVQELIRLAKIDEVGARYKKESFNMSEMAQETAESFLPVAESNGKTLEISVDPNIEYLGNEEDLREVISILLDNAIKYSTDGAVIQFSTSWSGRNILIKTSNPCEKISQDKLKRLTDRFYRGDESHSSTQKGYGLGLSIASSIAEHHRGELTVESQSGTDITFTVRLG